MDIESPFFCYDTCQKFIIGSEHLSWPDYYKTSISKNLCDNMGINRLLSSFGAQLCYFYKLLRVQFFQEKIKIICQIFSCLYLLRWVTKSKTIDIFGLSESKNAKFHWNWIPPSSGWLNWQLIDKLCLTLIFSMIIIDTLTKNGS